MKKSVALLPLIFCTINAWAQESSQQYHQLLQRFFDQQPPLCLGIKAWPIHIQASASNWETGRILALADAGLVIKTNRGVEDIYRLSPQMQKKWALHGDLCYASMAVSRIVKIGKTAGNLTTVVFTYHLASLEKWATHPSLRFAFSDMDFLLSGVNKARYIATFKSVNGQPAEIIAYPVPEELEY
ncbi:carbapenem biosynthesis protein CpmH [Salmonella enterica]